MSDKFKKVKVVNLIVGILFIGVGVGFVLEAAGMINFGDLLKYYWPAAVFLIGTAGMITEKTKSAYVLLSIYGLFKSIEHFAKVSVSLWDTFVPVLAIVFGAIIVSRSWR